MFYFMRLYLLNRSHCQFAGARHTDAMQGNGIPCSVWELSVFNLVSFEQISFEEMHQSRISHKCHSCARLLASIACDCEYR